MVTITETLNPTTEQGWRVGFKNLFRNEMNLRWGGRRWISSVLIWVAILNGFVFLVALGDEPGTRQDAMDVFANIGIIATSIGIVISAQGSIIREKQLGTPAWVLSKPPSREAFILAKWLPYAFSSVVLSLFIPLMVFVIQNQLLWNQIPPFIPLLEGWLVMVLQLQFYLALTLLLGTLFSTRGPVTGIGLGFLFGGLILINFLPDWVTLALPWVLKDVVAGLALGKPLPPVWPIPVVATAIWTVVFIGAALWRFSREEF